MWKAVLGLVGLVLIAVLFIAYRVLDAGVTQTYQQAEIERLQTENRVLGQLAQALAQGRSEAEIRALVERSLGEHLLKREGPVLFVDQIGLRFEGGRLARVVLVDDLPEADSNAAP